MIEANGFRVGRGGQWHCPEQSVELNETWDGRWYASSKVAYTTPAETPPGFIVIGDAHSHGDLPAYASTTDLEDEVYKDGLHIIVGRLDRERVDVSIEFAMDRRRFVVDPVDILEDPELVDSESPPLAWKEKLGIKRYSYSRYPEWKR